MSMSMRMSMSFSSSAAFRLRVLAVLRNKTAGPYPRGDLDS